MSVFDTLDYKFFLTTWVAERPGGGRGEYRRMAAGLGVSTTLISQVINGDKHFSLELASDLCDYLGLAEQDAQHFLLLIEWARAGTHGYRQRLQKRIEVAQAQAQKLSQRLDKDRDLTDAQSAVYYSSWVYTAITHLVACDSVTSDEALADRLRIPRVSVIRAIDFLLQAGILLKTKQSYTVNVKKTHLAADSPLVIKHHQNWRLQGFNRMGYASDEELFYTGPMSMSKETAQLVRRELPTVIEKIIRWVGPSPSEVVRCLNIDWFSF